MSRVVISSVGTSLLTQQLSRSEPAEKDWYSILRDNANLTYDDTPKEVLEIIRILKTRAIAKLNSSSIQEVRSASAELNGIYGLYDNNLEQAKADMHWLICTDTAQGQETGAIVESFLRETYKLNVQCYQPQGLSTANNESFSSGVDDLLSNLEGMTKGYDKVYFNLVGGFKALQGFLNTIGMFYADEIIYIFEGENAQLITIPRLPIKVDESFIEPYKVQLALMAAGSYVKLAMIKDLRESLIFIVEDEATLSNWGRLIWEQAKQSILSGDLLSFPRISYEQSFRKDYQNIKVPEDRVKLQETLAKVVYLLEKNMGDLTSLKGDGGLQYENYKNTKIDHFRVTQGLRISCQLSPNGDLCLRHYGTHDHVERSEKI